MLIILCVLTPLISYHYGLLVSTQEFTTAVIGGLEVAFIVAVSGIVVRYSDSRQDEKERSESINETTPRLRLVQSQLPLTAGNHEASIDQTKYEVGKIVWIEAKYSGQLVHGCFTACVWSPIGKFVWVWDRISATDKGLRGTLNGEGPFPAKWPWVIPKDWALGKSRIFIYVNEKKQARGSCFVEAVQMIMQRVAGASNYFQNLGLYRPNKTLTVLGDYFFEVVSRMSEDQTM